MARVWRKWENLGLLKDLLVQAQYTSGLYCVNLAKYRNYSNEWEIDARRLNVCESVQLSKINYSLPRP